MPNRFDNQYFFFAAVLLAVGDLLALYLFSSVIRMELWTFHWFNDIWQTPIPFMMIWVLSSILVGSYRSKAYSSTGQAAKAVWKILLVWSLFTLLISWFMMGSSINLLYVLLALAILYIFMLMWRWAFTLLMRAI